MKPLTVLLFLCLSVTAGYTQCADTFEVKSIEKATQAGDDGKIVVQVNSSGNYVYELHSYVNAKRTRLSEKSGNGSATIVFDKLNNTDFYRITFKFLEEKDPFCKTRVIDQIMLIGNKRKL